MEIPIQKPRSHPLGETEAWIHQHLPLQAALGGQSMPHSSASRLITTSGMYPCETQSPVSRSRGKYLTMHITNNPQTVGFGGWRGLSRPSGVLQRGKDDQEDGSKCRAQLLKWGKLQSPPHQLGKPFGLFGEKPGVCQEPKALPSEVQIPAGDLTPGRFSCFLLAG